MKMTVTTWHIHHVVSAVHTDVLVRDLGVVARVCGEGCGRSIMAGGGGGCWRER